MLMNETCTIWHEENYSGQSFENNFAIWKNNRNFAPQKKIELKPIEKT